VIRIRPETSRGGGNRGLGRGCPSRADKQLSCRKRRRLPALPPKITRRSHGAKPFVRKRAGIFSLGTDAMHVTARLWRTSGALRPAAERALSRAPMRLPR